MAKFVFDLKYVHHGALPVWATVPYMYPHMYPPVSATGGFWRHLVRVE